MDIYNNILNMSYFKFHELWTIIWEDWNPVQWWAIMTEQPWQSGEVLLLTKWAESFLMLFVDASIDQGTERILSRCRKDPVIYRTNCPGEPNQLIILW